MINRQFRIGPVTLFDYIDAAYNKLNKTAYIENIPIYLDANDCYKLITYIMDESNQAFCDNDLDRMHYNQSFVPKIRKMGYDQFNNYFEKGEGASTLN